MDATQIPNDSGHDRFKSAEEEQRRLKWEAEMIAEADAEIEAGLYVNADEIDAWIDSIGTHHELPPPPTRRRPPADADPTATCRAGSSTRRARVRTSTGVVIG